MVPFELMDKIKAFVTLSVQHGVIVSVPDRMRYYAEPGCNASYYGAL